MDIKDIYSQVILEHSSSKKNKKELENITYTKKGINPSCGDEIVLNLYIKDNIICDVSFNGIGCAISQASTSIMIDLIKGKTLEQAKSLADIFIKLIRKEDLTKEEKESLGDGLALENISNMPARVKCAILPWYTLKEIDKEEKEE